MSNARERILSTSKHISKAQMHESKNPGVFEGLLGVKKQSDEHTANFHQIVFTLTKTSMDVGTLQHMIIISFV